MDNVIITRKFKSPITWGDVADEVHSGRGNQLLEIGDTISATLTNGKSMEFLVSAMNPYSSKEVAFSVLDCLSNRRLYMNRRDTNEGGWSACDARAVLNSEIYDLLPDDMKKIIKPRVIVQKINDELLESTDKLWYLSEKELSNNDRGVDIDNVHFPVYDSRKSRIKCMDDVPTWYSTRSPDASTTTNFRYVHGNGLIYDHTASGSYGVAFGFLI